MSVNFQIKVTFPRRDSHAEQDGIMHITPLAGGVAMVQFMGTTNYQPGELRLIADTLRLAADHATEAPQ